MKKILAVTVFAFCAVLLFALPGCSSLGPKGTKNNGKSYAEIMNEKLVSFTDCANAFSDSLEKIGQAGESRQGACGDESARGVFRSAERAGCGDS